MVSARRTLATLAYTVLVVCGCAQPESKSLPPAPPSQTEPPAPAPAPPIPPPTAPRVSDTERLLYYYEYALALPPEQLAREQERTQRFFGQNRSEFALLQLVLLRCLPGSSIKDRTQGQEMLSSYLKEARDRASELRPFALMLNNLISEQLRQETEIQTQIQKVKDETRRNDQLQQKLDALVETERKMLERSKPARKP